MTELTVTLPLSGGESEITVSAIGHATQDAGSHGRRWRVWAKVAGPQLPDETISIGKLFMGSAHGLQKPPEPVDNLELKIGDSPDVFYTTSGTYDRAITPCWCWVDVEADDAQKAIKLVEYDVIPSVAASLSVHSPAGPYRFRMIGAINLGSGEPASALSRAVRVVGHWGPSVMTPDLTANFQDVFQVISDSKDLERSAHLIYKAASIAGLGTSPHLRGAALLGYYQAIEAAANVIPYSLPKDFELQQKAILSTLRAGLERKSETKKLRSAVVVAETSLARLEAKYVTIRIENTARILELPNVWFKRFKELSKTRNQKLGHASDPLQPNSFDEWFSNEDYESRAEWITNEFLKGLVLWKRTEKWKQSHHLDDASS